METVWRLEQAADWPSIDAPIVSTRDHRVVTAVYASVTSSPIVTRWEDGRSEALIKPTGPALASMRDAVMRGRSLWCQRPDGALHVMGGFVAAPGAPSPIEDSIITSVHHWCSYDCGLTWSRLADVPNKSGGLSR